MIWWSHSVRSISPKSSVKFSNAATKYKLIPKKPASATNKNAAFNWIFNAEYRNNMIYSKMDSSRNKYLNHTNFDLLWFIFFCYEKMMHWNRIGVTELTYTTSHGYRKWYSPLNTPYNTDSNGPIDIVCADISINIPYKRE